jgi:hypothetical protein
MRQYNHVQKTAIRNIPFEWGQHANIGRTDMSLDCITDPACDYVVFDKAGCWTCCVSTDDHRRALELHPW